MPLLTPCEISGSHSSEREDDSLLIYVLCSLVEGDQCFRGAYCLHLQGDKSKTVPLHAMEALERR
jgi:hypothetical protein